MLMALGPPALRMLLVAGVTLQREGYLAFRKLIDEGVGTFRVIMTFFAVVIAVGVVYNSARIALAERSRDLASLRVFGFSKGETAYILIGELALLIVLALPLGALFGYGLSWYISTLFSNEIYQIPFLIHPSTYGEAAGVILIAALVSSLLVVRDINKLDLIAVLKTRE